MSWQTGLNVVHFGLAFPYMNPEMPGSSHDVATTVPIAGSISGSLCAGVPRLRDELVGDSVELLTGAEVVVAVEDDTDTFADKKPMDGHGPAGTVLSKGVAAVEVTTTPFVEPSCFRPTSGVAVQPADQVMDEHELE